MTQLIVSLFYSATRPSALPTRRPELAGSPGITMMLWTTSSSMTHVACRIKPLALCLVVSNYLQTLNTKVFHHTEVKFKRFTTSLRAGLLKQVAKCYLFFCLATTTRYCKWSSQTGQYIFQPENQRGPHILLDVYPSVLAPVIGDQSYEIDTFVQLF